MSRRSGGSRGGGDSKRIREITNGANEAPRAPKKPRTTKSSAVAETAPTLNEKQLKIAREFHRYKTGATDGLIAALSIEPVQDEFAGPYLLRLLAAKGMGGAVQSSCLHILSVLATPLATYKLKAAQRRTALSKALTGVTAVALLAAGAPQETEKEEGHVEGTVDVKPSKGDDIWRRYRDPTAAGDGTPGVSAEQIRRALKRLRANPKDTYAEDRGFEVRDVTDAVRCATATNKVVRGFHEEKMKAGTYERKTLTERLAGPEEEERKAKAARAAEDKETKKAVRKARYEMFGLAYSSVPPLPDGATDADLERLEDEDLEAMYGR